MGIPVIYTQNDIVEIFTRFPLTYKPLSENMFWFGFDNTYQVGSIALSQNEIRCRFHYTDGSKIHTKTFIYDYRKFAKEMKKARKAWHNKKLKELDDTLDILD